MVIENQYPQFCFLGALPDLVLGQVTGTVSVQLYLGDFPVVEEVYAGDRNRRVTVRGLRDFITDRVDGKFNPDDFQSMVPVVRPATIAFSMLAVDQSGTRVQADIDVVPTRVPFASDLNNRFLVRDNRFRFGPNDTFFLSFYNQQHSVQIDVIDLNGDASSIEVPGTNSEGDSLQLVTCKFDMSHILDEAGLVAREVASVVVKLLSIEGRGVVDDAVVIEMDDAHKFEKLVFYDNLFYVPQSVKFCGSESEEMPYSNDVGNVRGKFSVLAHEVHHEYVLRSGPLPHSAYLNSQDILLADSVFVSADGGTREIAILEANVARYMPAKEPDHFYIKYRLSEEPQQTIERTQEKPGMFAKPYTEAYD